MAEPHNGVMRRHGLLATGGIVAWVGCCVCVCCVRVAVCVCGLACSCSCSCLRVRVRLRARGRVSVRACVCVCVCPFRGDVPPGPGHALLLRAGALYVLTVGPRLGRQRI